MWFMFILSIICGVLGIVMFGFSIMAVALGPLHWVANTGMSLLTVLSSFLLFDSAIDAWENFKRCDHAQK